MSAGGCKARSTNLLAVFALVTIAGCATVVLELASVLTGPTHADELVRLESAAPDGSDSTTSTSTPRTAADDPDHRPYFRDIGHSHRRPLVDRRFTGQATGRAPLPEEEGPHRLPASREGPFGWGTDWIAGVGLPGPGGGQAEDVIEPAWCQASPGNRSFVETVMERRVKGPVNTSSRVVFCTRTKDRGRYLPEWVAYNWALGVDEFDIYDDDSVDDTREVLEPFVQAGMVRFQPHRILRNASDEHDNTRATTMAPLKQCVERYREMHVKGDPSAPRWLAVVDTDEYLWAADVATTAGLPELLGTHSSTCCLQVSTVQHGTSGFSKTPRGLLLENFLKHADPASAELNGPPKLVINFGPAAAGGASSYRGAAPQNGTEDDDDLHSLLLGTGTDGQGMFNNCRCEMAPVEELAVRRFPITREDVDSKEKRYLALGQQQPVEEVTFNEAAEAAALNNYTSDGILAWRCVVRLVLSRAANGRHVVTNQPQNGLSPHHPINHGVRPMDPFGEEELERTEACFAKLRSSPTQEGSTGGSVDSLPVWMHHVCRTRYIFVHSFQDTGEVQVVRSLAAHPWVRSHEGEAAVAGGGSALTTVVPAAQDRERTTGVDLKEMCGCKKGGCWRYCPKLQQHLLAPGGLEQKRRQLVQDWLLRFNFKNEPGKPLVLVERDPDMLLHSKQRLFPFVSTSVLTVRRPLCAFADAGGEGGGRASSSAAVADLREWREVWQQVLVNQVPHATGSVWVVRFEDLLLQEQEVSSALWAAVGLPPLSPYASATDPDRNPSNVGGQQQRRLRNRRLVPGDAMSRAPPAVRKHAIPAKCRATVAFCEKDPACQLELLRSSTLLDFFGYGGSEEMLNSQRFLWGKGELEWLGKRLSSEMSDDLLNTGGRGRVRIDLDDDEPSVIMRQAPRSSEQIRKQRGKGG